MCNFQVSTVPKFCIITLSVFFSISHFQSFQKKCILSKMNLDYICLYAAFLILRDDSND